MSMKSQKKANSIDEFDLIFNDRTTEEKTQDEARLLMYRFLDIFEYKCDKLGWSKKKLANEIGTSPSYITQLFRGDKLINLPTIVKMKQVLDIDIEITEKHYNELKMSDRQIPDYDGKGFWSYTPFKKPNYNRDETLPEVPTQENAA